MLKILDAPKILAIPTLKRFSGEDNAVYIFEEIMHRQRWAVNDRDALTAKIESIVAEEIQRQKKHTARVIEIKRTNIRKAREWRKENK